MKLWLARGCRLLRLRRLVFARASSVPVLHPRTKERCATRRRRPRCLCVPALGARDSLKPRKRVLVHVQARRVVWFSSFFCATLVSHRVRFDPPPASPPPTLRTYQYWLDRSVIYTTWRWAGFLVSLFLFLLKIYFYQRWFIVTYGLGIFLLNNLIGFLSPQVRSSVDDGPTLRRLYLGAAFFISVLGGIFGFGCTVSLCPLFPISCGI